MKHRIAVFQNTHYTIHEIEADGAMQALYIAEKTIPGIDHTKMYDKELGPLTLKCTERPEIFWQLSFDEQWNIDKKLGILDWSGCPFE